MPDRTKAHLIVLALLGALLLGFPALAVIDRLAVRYGPPLLPLYLFVVWGMIIVAAAAIVARLSRKGRR